MSRFRVLAQVAGVVALAGCATANTQEDGGPGSPVDATPPADAPQVPVVDAGPADAAPVDATPPLPDATPPADAAPPAPTTCTADTGLACGEIAQHSLLLADADIEGFACAGVPTTGPENIYTFTASADGTIVLALDVLEDDPLFGDDFDLYVLTPECSTATCIGQAATAGDDQLMFEATSGQTYFIVVEAFAQGLLTFMDYDLQITCL